MTRRPPPLLGIAAVALVVAGGVWLDARSTAPDSVPEGGTAGPANAGAWYCAVGDTEQERDLTVTAAAPSVGRTPAEVAVDVFKEGTRDSGRTERVFPAAATSRHVDANEEAVGIASRWWEAPVAVHRTWEVGQDPADSLPAGRLAGPCEHEPSRTWVVPGMATSGGAEAELVLANPFSSDASVSVALPSPEGLLEPQRLRNVVVPANSTRAVSVNEHAPERTDLAALVTLRSGRVVVEGMLSLDAAIGEVDGVSLLGAAPESAETWTVPWVQASGGSSTSWLWVTNVSERAAALEVTVHTGDGGSVPAEIGEVTVPPGEVERIDLGDVVGEDVASAGVTVRSTNGVAVAASAATQVTAPQAERSGVTVQRGASAPDETWVLDAGDAEGRIEQLNMVNPGGEPARVDVSIWNGSSVSRPDELQDLEVAPGSRRAAALGLAETGGRAHTVVVQASDGEVVAGLTSRAQRGPLALVAALGVPGSVWRGGQPALAVEPATGLTQRIGTNLGVEPIERIPEPDTEPDDPVPSPTPPTPGTPSPTQE